MKWFRRVHSYKDYKVLRINTSLLYLGLVFSQTRHMMVAACVSSVSSASSASSAISASSVGFARKDMNERTSATTS